MPISPSTFKKGFTVIEMLIVLSVSAMLTSLLIVYSRTGEKQILLMREQARLLNTVLRSKSMAVQTFIDAPEICGYGVHFEAQRYILFKDLAPDCAASDKIYSGEAENVEVVDLDPGVKFVDPTLTDVIYLPPDPKTILTPNQQQAIVTFALVIDEKSTVKIKINNAGQVTTQ